jgi:hypothetical protein
MFFHSTRQSRNDSSEWLEVFSRNLAYSDFARKANAKRGKGKIHWIVVRTSRLRRNRNLYEDQESSDEAKEVVFSILAHSRI